MQKAKSMCTCLLLYMHDNNGLKAHAGVPTCTHVCMYVMYAHTKQCTYTHAIILTQKRERDLKQVKVMLPMYSRETLSRKRGDQGWW